MCTKLYLIQKVDKYMKNAKDLITSQDPNDIVSALSLLNSTLSISPHHELALELKARSLLYLRRFKDVAVLLHNYIPSLRIDNEDVSSVFAASSELSSLMLLLPSGSPSHDSSFKCFSYSYLKNKVMAGLSNKSEVQGQWRYLVFLVMTRVFVDPSVTDSDLLFSVADTWFWAKLVTIWV